MSRLQRDSFVRGVLEENEEMLHEIDTLRARVANQSEELFAAKRRIEVLETHLTGSKDTAGTMYEKTIDADTVFPDKAGILCSILRAISAYQFGSCFTRLRSRKRRMLLGSCEATLTPDGENTKESNNSLENQVCNHEEEAMMKQALCESNRLLDEVYCLLQSYKETPSFSVTSYDQLIIDCLMEVVALSKMNNAMAAGDTGSPMSRAKQLLSAQGSRAQNGLVLITPRLPGKFLGK